MTPFSLLLGIGASLGLLRVVQTAPASSRLRWMTTALITLTGALIGARVGFVVAYASYFKIHPQEIIQITHGGLSWPGAVVGAILFAWLALMLFKLPKLAGFDHMSRMILPIAVAGWLAAWQASIGYGQLLPADTWWGMTITDDSGLTALRVPVQAFAVLSLILLLGVSEWLVRHAQKPGVKAAVITSIISIHALLFSFLRVDAVQRFFGLRLDTWVGIFFLSGSITFLIIILTHKKPIPAPEVTEMEKQDET